MPDFQEPFSDIDVDQVARNLRHLDDAQIAETMSGDGRPAVLDAVFGRMCERCDPAAAASVRTLVRFVIEGADADGVDRFDVEVADGRCRTSREPLGDPVATVFCDAVTLLRLVLGGAGARELADQGRLTVEGDAAAAADLRLLFVIPG